MPALFLSVPLFLIAIALGCYAFLVDDSYAPLLLLPCVPLAIVFVLSPQINWWWYKRNPPDLPEPLKRLAEHTAYYKTLPEKLQLRFRQKTAMFITGNDFRKPTDEGGVPEDIRAAAAMSAVPLLMGQEELVLPPFEIVIVYANPFPSPQYPTQLHLSEIYEEDGVVLFSAEHLMKGLFQPAQFFPIGLYEYAKVVLCLREKQGLFTPKPEESMWQQIEQMGSYSRKIISKWMGLGEQDIELPAVAIVHFLTFPEAFKALLPELFDAYCEMLNQNPLDLAALENELGK